MVTIRVEGLKSAQAALDLATKDIKDSSEEMLTVILQGISASTMPYVPVDTSALITSERRRTAMTASGPVGSIEYGGLGDGVNPKTGTPVQEYAAIVHEGPQKNWQKPGASNLFLARGAGDFIRDDLTNILARYSQ